MYTPDEKAAQRQIDEVMSLVKEVLGPDLLGLYLYGSSRIGGLQLQSDIDLFVVSKRPTTYRDKQRLIKGLLSISNVDPLRQGRPIELTVVVQSRLRPWQYPPSFDFQYGDWMRKDFEAGNVAPWESSENADLSILITQVLLSGKTLAGAGPLELLDPVPYADFIKATVDEITQLLGDLDHDTRNVLLTLARIWSTVATDEIRSKQDAANWALPRLPDGYRPVLVAARDAYLGQQKDDWEGLLPMVRPCAEFMADQAEREVDDRQDDSIGRVVRIARNVY